MTLESCFAKAAMARTPSANRGKRWRTRHDRLAGRRDPARHDKSERTIPGFKAVLVQSAPIFGKAIGLKPNRNAEPIRNIEHLKHDARADAFAAQLRFDFQEVEVDYTFLKSRNDQGLVTNPRPQGTQLEGYRFVERSNSVMRHR